MESLGAIQVLDEADGSHVFIQCQLDASGKCLNTGLAPADEGPPGVAIFASDDTVTAGQSLVPTWSSANANVCYASGPMSGGGGWGGKGLKRFGSASAGLDFGAVRVE